MTPKGRADEIDTRPKGGFVILTLSKETEALARHLAALHDEPVDDAIRAALETAMSSVQRGQGRTVSYAEVARRRAVIEAFAHALEVLPLIDPRSPGEIVDEINEL